MLQVINFLASIIIIGVFVWVIGSVTLKRIQKWWQFSNIRTGWKGK